MRFNVAQQLREGIGARRIYDVAEVLLSDGGQQYSAQGTVDLLRTKGGILVRAHLDTTAQQTCSRCLEAFQCVATIELEEEFLSPAEGEQAVAPESLEIETPFTIDEKQVLDLEEAMRQYQILAQPMKPLCQSNCAGLCPQCGANLNLGPCGCPATAVDPRWEALKGLTVEEKQPTPGQKGNG